MNRQNDSTSEWEYHRGEWTEGRVPWHDEDWDDWDELMKQYGYYCFWHSDGDDSRTTVIWYNLAVLQGAKLEDNRPAYLFDVEIPSNTCQMVMVREFPSYVRLLGELRAAGFPLPGPDGEV